MEKTMNISNGSHQPASLPIAMTTDGNASFLRAARAGNLEKVLDYLKANIDINTSNANGLNALHLAAKEGHVDIVTELLKKGANVNAATKKGNTALHIASLAGQEEVVKVLVNLGANVNVQSQNGFTPLYMAAQENHDSVVSFLLANGANQSLATEDGFTPLAVALQQGHDKVVAVLLENDTKGRVRLPALHIAAKKDDCKAATLLLQNDHNPDVTSKSGFTPLHIAAHYGNENIANILLDKGADVNYAAKHLITPLHVASKWGKSNMVTLLLDKGAKIDASTRDGLTPLHCAARSGHDQVVDLLLERGAPILAKTKNGLAPLHMASQGDHVDSARILLYHKAPVDDVTVDYLTALHVAAHCGHVKVAKLLLDRKADPNARALNGFTPLHIACKKNRIKVVELLLKHGASIEATTESGLTPLHVASFMGCMNIVIYLIQNGANPDVPTVRGETPLHLAARANQTDIIRILLRNGANVDARAREEQTPLHIAARLGNVDIVSLLLQHGAAVDATTKDMYTALHIAAKEDQDEVASVLLDHGSSLTATTKKGFTPLHLAAKYGNIKVARLLLQKDAPVDAQGKNGVTPLHVAAHYDHINVALLLLDKGASPHATAKNGYTPLHIAAKKNQMDIATTLLEYGAQCNAESKAGFTPLHLASQEGHTDMAALLIEHKGNVNCKANNGLTPLHLCAQDDRVNVASILVKNGAEIGPQTKTGYTPLHVASHFGSMNMVRFLLQNNANVHVATSHGYTPLHQAAQQGHTLVINLLLENKASPNVITSQGQTPLSIAQRLGYISVIETLKVVTETTVTTTTTTVTEEKYKVVAPETMQETFMTDSEDEGGEDTMLGDQSYRYLTADEMKSLGDDSLPIDVTKDEKQHESMRMIKDSAAPMVEEDKLSPQRITPVESGFSEKYSPDNVDISHAPVHAGSFSWDDGYYYYYSHPLKGMLRSSRLKWKTFLVSFMVDARGGAMRGCRHSGVRIIIPPRKASMPMRITCRYLRKEKLAHPPPLMEGEACASRILEVGPVGARFLGPVIIEVPHFASLRGREREVTILRSDTGETWREHTLEASEEAVQDVLNESFEGEELSALEDLNTNRITRILTTDFPQYFAIITRIRQEVHGVGPEGGMVSSTVVPQVQAIFPEGALTKKIRVGLQAQPIAPEVVAKLLGNRVAVSPIVTVEPRRRKFHKPITLTIPVPQAATKGMINQYSGDAPTLRLLCSITGSTKSGGSSKAQWEDVTGSTPLTFVNDCVSFTTTVSARFWLMDCRQVSEATKFATELYQEAVHVPFMSKFVVFAKRHDPNEAQLRVFCMTDDKEDKTLETQEHFTEIAKSRDVEVLEGKLQYLEFAGNLIPVTNSGEQLKLIFHAFHENRLPFSIRVKDPHMEPMGRIAFMKEPKVSRGEPPQTPICNLNIALPEVTVCEPSLSAVELVTFEKKYDIMREDGLSAPESIHRADLRLSDIARELDKDWVVLAHQFDMAESDIDSIKSECVDNISEQALIMLRLWLQKSGSKATGNELEKGLRKINREDIIRKCMFNVELVTDDVEKAVAKVHLDQSGFDVFKEELGSSREASMRRGVSLDISYDEQDIMREAESAAETSSDTGSLFERDQISQAFSHDKENVSKDLNFRDIQKNNVVCSSEDVSLLHESSFNVSNIDANDLTFKNSDSINEQISQNNMNHNNGDIVTSGVEILPLLISSCNETTDKELSLNANLIQSTEIENEPFFETEDHIACHYAIPSSKEYVSSNEAVENVIENSSILNNDLISDVMSSANEGNEKNVKFKNHCLNELLPEALGKQISTDESPYILNTNLVQSAENEDELFFENEDQIACHYSIPNSEEYVSSNEAIENVIENSSISNIELILDVMPSVDKDNEKNDEFENHCFNKLLPEAYEKQISTNESINILDTNLAQNTEIENEPLFETEGQITDHFAMPSPAEYVLSNEASKNVIENNSILNNELISDVVPSVDEDNEKDVELENHCLNELLPEVSGKQISTDESLYILTDKSLKFDDSLLQDLNQSALVSAAKTDNVSFPELLCSLTEEEIKNPKQNIIQDDIDQNIMQDDIDQYIIQNDIDQNIMQGDTEFSMKIESSNRLVMDECRPTENIEDLTVPAVVVHELGKEKNEKFVEFECIDDVQSIVATTVKHTDDHKLKNESSEKNENEAVNECSKHASLLSYSGEKHVVEQPADNTEEEGKARRVSKTPPPSPAENVEKEFKIENEVDSVPLNPEENVLKQVSTTLVKTVGNLDNIVPEMTQKLTESETWPSGEMDTSQVSVSSLPDDEKSEPSTATVSSTATAAEVDVDKIQDQKERTEVDESGKVTHIIQKTTHMTLSMQQKLDEVSKEGSQNEVSKEGPISEKTNGCIDIHVCPEEYTRVMEISDECKVLPVEKKVEHICTVVKEVSDQCLETKEQKEIPDVFCISDEVKKVDSEKGENIISAEDLQISDVSVSQELDIGIGLTEKNGNQIKTDGYDIVNTVTADDCSLKQSKDVVTVLTDFEDLFQEEVKVKEEKDSSKHDDDDETEKKMLFSTSEKVSDTATDNLKLSDTCSHPEQCQELFSDDHDVNTDLMKHLVKDPLPVPKISTEFSSKQNEINIVKDSSVEKIATPTDSSDNIFSGCESIAVTQFTDEKLSHKDYVVVTEHIDENVLELESASIFCDTAVEPETECLIKRLETTSEVDLDNPEESLIKEVIYGSKSPSQPLDYNSACSFSIDTETKVIPSGIISEQNSEDKISDTLENFQFVMKEQEKFETVSSDLPSESLEDTFALKGEAILHPSEIASATDSTELECITPMKMVTSRNSQDSSVDKETIPSTTDNRTLSELDQKERISDSATSVSLKVEGLIEAESEKH